MTQKVGNFITKMKAGDWWATEIRTEESVCADAASRIHRQETETKTYKVCPPGVKRLIEDGYILQTQDPDDFEKTKAEMNATKEVTDV